MLRAGNVRKGYSGVWNGHAHTAVFKINSQQEPTALNSAQGYVVAWKGGEFGKEWICVYVMAEFLHYSPEIVTMLLIGYTKQKVKC